MSKNEICVFVYGTLKRGWGNYQHYLEETADFISEAVSKDAAYSMGAVGFPLLIDGGDAKVKGELFWVGEAALAACDRLEGHPRMYKREQRIFQTPAGDLYEAWVYIYQTSGGRRDHGSAIRPNKDGLLIWEGYSDERG